jgi:hypothetical protein
MKRSIALAVLALPIALWSCRTNDAGTQTATTTSQDVTSAPDTMAPQAEATPTTAASTPITATITPTPATPAATPTPAPQDELATAARITVPELQQRIKDGKAVILDVRAPEAYNESHILGAINIPLGELASRAKELPKDKLIAAYCT